ncbi:hypothetical protein [Methanoculleus sp.]|uniref:hypothetical protein n=1 Tax=Methanoculleus sp. TaxID=90427 RepID=UPI001BD45875|nr:hypothetical protein [Methanoculleus sp.]
MRRLELPPLDLDGDRCPASRRSLGLESKQDRVSKRFQIDKPLVDVLEAHVNPRGQSDIINQGLNLVAIMNGWL